MMLSNQIQAETLIIIPTYNESLNIEKMMNQIMELYPEIHLLIVDDNSPDKTYERVQEKQSEYDNIHLIKRKYKDGIASAYIAGFKFAIENKYKRIVQMDCDFSHDPKDVKFLIEQSQNADLVIGSRYIGGLRVINWPIKRFFISFFASIYIRAITGIPIIDCTGGFKCMRINVLETLNLSDIISRGYIFQTEINFKAWTKEFKLLEVPIIFHDRTLGESKIQNKMILEGLKNVLILKYRSFREK